MNLIDIITLYMPYILLLSLPIVLYAANSVFKKQNVNLLNEEDDKETLLNEVLSTTTDQKYSSGVRGSLRDQLALQINESIKVSHEERHLNTLKNRNVVVLTVSNDLHIKHNLTAYYISSKKIQYNPTTEKFKYNYRSDKIKILKFEELKEGVKFNKLFIKGNKINS